MWWCERNIAISDVTLIRKTKDCEMDSFATVDVPHIGFFIRDTQWYRAARLGGHSRWSQCESLIIVERVDLEGDPSGFRSDNASTHSKNFFFLVISTTAGQCGALSQ